MIRGNLRQTRGAKTLARRGSLLGFSLRQDSVPAGGVD